MDVLTAGVALVLVQLCVALVMSGIFYAAPAEKCTRYWALSGILIAAGVLGLVSNHGVPRYSVLLASNNMLMIGLALQWSGIRAFYRKPPGYQGWLIAALFFLAFAWLLWAHAPVNDRSKLSAVTILAMMILYFYEVATAPRSGRSFAAMLVLSALAMMIASYSFRGALSLSGAAQFLPSGNSTLTVVLVYLVPIIGTLLLSNGLVLLYFERVIADKHHLATHDDLTGVLNRRAIVTAGERETQLATRLRLPLTVAFVDIDHFKQINDQLGHEAGDRVIAEAAQALKQACRSIDLIGRYGGEEFCLIFPGVDRDGAAAIGARLLQAMREHPSGIDRRVTISAGLAALAPGDDDRSWAGLIRRADEELYRAKAAGRDCFFVADANLDEKRLPEMI